MGLPALRNPRRRLSYAQKEEIAGYLFILPWVVGFLAFNIGPMFVSLYLSFLDADFLTPPTFIGLANYTTLFTADPLFWKALGNTAYYAFARVPLGIVISIAIALLLNREVRGVSFFRTVYYLPSVVSGVAVALLWVWIFNPDYGLLNAGLGLLHLGQPRWLFSETYAMPALILMSLWGAGGSMIIYLAGLRSVPPELYDAAAIDGAGRLRQFRFITIPMLTPTIFYSLITGIIFSFQIFLNSYVMTQGGPNNATLTYVLYLFQKAFQQFHMGYASALAWIFFLIILFFTVLVFRSSELWVYYESEVKGRRT